MDTKFVGAVNPRPLTADEDLYGKGRVRNGLHVDDLVEFVKAGLTAPTTPVKLDGIHRGHPRFYELLREMERIHDDRNSDYANDTDPLRNFKACQRFGLTPFQGILTRMSDKVERIYNLQQKRAAGASPATADDRLTDSLMDLACYSLLGIVLLEEEGQ